MGEQARGPSGTAAASAHRRGLAWQPDDALDLASMLAAAGLAGLIAAGAAGPARVLLAFGFAFFVPGRAIAANWPALGQWSRAAVPVGLSLAVTGALATLTLWWHIWHPAALAQVIAAASLIALAAAVVRRHRPQLTAGDRA